eukprot:91026-Amphidinium_carterae.2
MAGGCFCARGRAGEFSASATLSKTPIANHPCGQQLWEEVSQMINGNCSTIQPVIILPVLEFAKALYNFARSRWSGAGKTTIHFHHY